MELYLLLCAVVLLLCIFSNKISDKIGVPSLLIFMFLGMVFGSEGIFKIEFSDFQAAENICTAALIFIMFYGGYSTNWEHARPAAGRAAVLSTLGVGIGAAVGIAGPKIIRKFRFCTDGFDAVFVLAAALTSYALAGILGGNGFLSVYLTGILMGNAKTKNKANVVRFFDNVTILAQIATFFLIGLLSYPSQMVSSLPATLVIILFLTLAARPAMVFILTGRYLKFREKIFVSFAGLRGASSIVFAIFASAGGVYMQSNVFHIVFGLSLMQLHISSGHHWENQKLKDVTLPEGSLAMVIRREDDIIIPKGDTVMMAGDDIAVNVPSFEAANEISLREITIEEDHPWRDKKIKELDLKEHILVAMIRRKDQDIIPNGETKIYKDDILVIYDE